MNCIHAPQSLADAERILACYGGTNWRDLFVTGLVTLVLVVLAVTLVLLAVRQVTGH